MRSYGPPPLKEMTEDLLRAYKATIAFWAEDFKMMPLNAIDVTEVSGAEPVMHDDNVIPAGDPGAGIPFRFPRSRDRVFG